MIRLGPVVTQAGARRMETQLPVAVTSTKHKADDASRSRAKSQSTGMLLVASIGCAAVVAMAVLSRVEGLGYRVGRIGSGRVILSWLLIAVGQSFVVGLIFVKLRPIGRIVRASPLGRRSLAILIPLASLACSILCLILLATVQTDDDALSVYSRGDYWYVKAALAVSMPLCVGACAAIVSLLTRCRDMFFTQLCFVALALVGIQGLAYVTLLRPAWLGSGW
jgi:hypothetical protein